MLVNRTNFSALPILPRALQGIKWGLQMAAGLALFAVIARVVGGDKIFEGGLSFSQLLEAEFAAGVLGGLVLGISLPILTTSVRAAFIGFVIGAISGFAGLIAQKGLTDWTIGELGITIPFAIVGVIVAVGLKRRADRMLNP